MITGTPAAVQAVAKLVDHESRLPLASTSYPCVCGYHLIEVADYDLETVRCTACGTVTPAGDRAATIQVKNVKKHADGTATYDSDPELEDKIKKAKVKPPKKTEEEEILSAVEVVEVP